VQRTTLENASHSCARVMGLVQELDELATLEEQPPSASATRVKIIPLCKDVVEAARKGARGPSGVIFTAADADQMASVGGEAAPLKKALAAFVAAAGRELVNGQPVEVYAFVSRGGPEAVIAVGPVGVASRQDEILADARPVFGQWRGGTGLSLPIACRIIENHGGHVWSLSADSHAAMAFSLPLLSLE